LIAAHDVYAETNPGYCAATIAHFAKAYSESSVQHPILALAYLALPLALSEDLSSTFDGCNARTGLIVWLDRNPRITINLASRVNPSLTICTEAIRYGCLIGILTLDQLGRLTSTSAALPTETPTNTSSRTFKRSRLLGTWFAGTGSARSVFESLGVSI